MGSCRGVREGNVTNDLSILPGMGKIKFPRVASNGAPVESETYHTMQPVPGLRYREKTLGPRVCLRHYPRNEMNPLAGIYGSCAFS